MTFTGAYHHCMSRGYEGNSIFGSEEMKGIFLDILATAASRHRVHLLAYCIMDNHYHLVLQNNGRMSDFFKLLNGEFGIHYRRSAGGTGYVFQGRYKSTLIQDDTYLRTAIAYVLANPVRAGIAPQFQNYPWSSGHLYYKGNSLSLVDTAFVENLFDSMENLNEFIGKWGDDSILQVVNTELGGLLGTQSAFHRLKQKQNRRERGETAADEHRRKSEGFASVQAVVRDFVKATGINPNQVDFHSREGQRVRRELLVQLKERAGLTYREIARLKWFQGVKMNSLGKIYGDGKSKVKK